MSRYNLPILYHVDKKGQEREWKIWVEGNTVYKEYGVVNGKHVFSKRSYEGVNQHNKLATTPEEQAKREAERDWVKQQDKSYLPKCDEGKKLRAKIVEKKSTQGNTNVQVATVIRGESKGKAVKKTDVDTLILQGYISPLRPMLCHEWELDEHGAVLPKVLKYFKEGIYVQPKLDGVRCLVRILDGKVVMTTRNGNQIRFLGKQRDEFFLFLKGYKDVVLDCEVYSRTFRAEIRDTIYYPSDKLLNDKERIFPIISAVCNVSRTDPYPIEDQVNFCVFDIADTTIPQDKRFDFLHTLFDRKVSKKCPHIESVVTTKISSVNDIPKIMEQYISQGYEGVILRASDLMYQSDARALGIRKLKPFFDEEFKIIGVHHDTGVDTEHFSWVCEIGSTSFRVKPMGTREERRQWYQDEKKYRGVMLTVKYQEKTPDGIPRFPSAKGFRNFE